MTRNPPKVVRAVAASLIVVALSVWLRVDLATAVDELAGRKAEDDLSRGAAYMERCMFEEAVAAFSRAASAGLEGDKAAYAFDRLGYLYWCRGWHGEAEKAMRESLRCAVDDEGRLRAKLALGQVLLDQGKPKEASLEFDGALEIVPKEDEDIVCLLSGIARFESQDAPGAAEMFLRALEASPDNPVARTYIERLPRSAQPRLPSAKAGKAGVPSGAADALQGVLFVNSGAQYTLAPHVTLTLGVTPDAPVRGFFLAAGDDTFRWHDWRSPAIEWRLAAKDDGKKRVRVVYYAGDPRRPSSVESSIVLDREPPRGSFEINEGRGYTNKARVTLNIHAGDRASGIANVSMSNDGATWSRWTMYQFTKEWDLVPGDGPKTVCLRFQDKAGNISTPVSARIVLDTVPPRFSWVEVARVQSTTADIAWSTDEESDSAVEYAPDKTKEILRVRDEDMTRLHHIRLSDLQPATRYRFRAMSRDRAGNLATSKELEFVTRAAEKTAAGAGSEARRSQAIGDNRREIDR